MMRYTGGNDHLGTPLINKYFPMKLVLLMLPSISLNFRDTSGLFL